MARLVPPLSVAVGWSKVQAVPSCTVLLVLLQLMTGAVVSTTLTVWLHWALLPQASVATEGPAGWEGVQMWVVAVSFKKKTGEALWVPPLWGAEGRSKVQASPRCRRVLLL